MTFHRSYRSVAALAALAALAGCATFDMLEAPAAADSAMGVVSMTFSFSGPFGDSSGLLPAQVVLGEVDPAGGVVKEIGPTRIYNKYAVFANLVPGKYRVLRAVYKVQGGPGIGVPVGGGFGIGISFSPSGTAEFGGEVVERTLVEVPAGAVAYLGDFSATLKPGFPSYGIAKSDGELTEEGKRRAYEMLRAVYSESPWAQKLKPPVFGIYVDELPLYIKNTTGPEQGVLVMAVGRDSPASKVGIQASDVVQHLGDKVITDRKSFEQALDEYAGKTVTVKYFRSESERTAEVTLNERM